VHLLNYIERAASLRPHHPALVAGGVAMGFNALAERTRQVGTSLSLQALPPGSTVAILSDNCPEVCVLQLGANLAGLAWTSIHSSNTDETTAQVLQYLDSRVVFFQSRYAAKAQAALEIIPGLIAVCIDDESTEGPCLESWLKTTDLMAAVDEPLQTTAAWLQHTGGPGGPCHGTVHSRTAIEIGLANVVDAFGATPDSRHLVLAPMTHAAGIFTLAFASVGATNVIHEQFALDSVDAALRGEGITHLFLPPTALYALLDFLGGPASYPSLQCVVVAGAPVEPARFKQAVDCLGPVLHEVYGQTETLLALVKRPADYLRGAGIDNSIARSAGRPVRFSHVALLTEAGTACAAGERGEIAVKSSMLMDGYYKKPELTARSRRAGWHLTGDIGVADAAGFVTIVDRKREMIITGSFNVFPGEVEQVLASHASVEDCSVFGVPDSKWGESVHAVVSLRSGSSLQESELLAWCKSGLGNIKAPKSISIVDASTMPRSQDGAVDRARLKAPYWDGQWRRV
jgi:acyl-CoA synthetase (AMP-forming)/AMP-acid ligase II